MATLVEPVVTCPVESTPDACSLDNYLAMPDHTMDGRIAAARARLGKDALILGHHYQRDEVIRFADFHRRLLQVIEDCLRIQQPLHPVLRCAFHG